MGLSGGEDLLLHQVGLLAAEAVQLDHEPTDIAELELAQLPEVAGPPAYLGPFSQSWTHGRSIGPRLGPTVASTPGRPLPLAPSSSDAPASSGSDRRVRLRS